MSVCWKVWTQVMWVLISKGGVGGCFLIFFFNDTATTEIYTLSLHDALPIFLAILVFSGIAF